MPVRAVVFDVGNVLHRWEPARLYAPLIPDEAARSRFLAEIVTTEWHFQHDAGRPFSETSAELSALHPEHAELIAAWGPRFLDTLPGPVEGMEKLVEELDAAGVPLYAITNFSAEFWPPFAAREAAMFDRFQAIVVSGKEKLIKPQPEIYSLALDRFGLGPGEGLFVDDRSDNVQAAERAGFVGHHFKNAAWLRSALSHLQLLPILPAAEPSNETVRARGRRSPRSTPTFA